MKLTENTIVIICIVTAIIGIIVLNFYEINPINKKIADLNEGDYVKVVATVQSIKAVRDKYRNIVGIKYITLMDETGGDLKVIAFNEINKELTNYVTSTNPSIKEGDLVEVTGNVKIYNGIYEIVLDDVKDFRLLEKRNFEKDVTFSPNPTGIYRSSNGKTYHTLENCPYGKKIKNKVYLYSEEDALILNYKKCKYCERHD